MRPYVWIVLRNGYAWIFLLIFAIWMTATHRPIEHPYFYLWGMVLFAGLSTFIMILDKLIEYQKSQAGAK